jgi:hypothetical protein
MSDIYGFERGRVVYEPTRGRAALLNTIFDLTLHVYPAIARSAARER